MAHIMSHICLKNSRKSLETKFVQCEEVEMIYPNKRALHFLVLGFWWFFFFPQNILPSYFIFSQTSCKTSKHLKSTQLIES